MKRRNILLTMFTTGVILIALNVTSAPASLTASVPIPWVGTVKYEPSLVRTVALSIGDAPPQDVIDKLHLEWTWGPFTWKGGNLDSLNRLLDAGIKHIVTLTMRIQEFPNFDDVMLCLRNNVEPSLTHPEIYGVYLNDYFGECYRGRTQEEWQQIVNYIRTTNPNLKIFIPWNYWAWKVHPADEYLSWISWDFDGVIMNFRLQPEQGLEQLEEFLAYAEQKFAGKIMWATAYMIRPETNELLTESEFRYICSHLTEHYDAGKIQGVRLYSYEFLRANPEYADYMVEEFVSVH